MRVRSLNPSAVGQAFDFAEELLQFRGVPKFDFQVEIGAFKDGGRVQAKAGGALPPQPGEGGLEGLPGREAGINLGVQAPAHHFRPLRGRGQNQSGRGGVPPGPRGWGNPLPAGQESDLVQQFFLLALAQPQAIQKWPGRGPGPPGPNQPAGSGGESQAAFCRQLLPGGLQADRFDQNVQESPGKEGGPSRGGIWPSRSPGRNGSAAGRPGRPAPGG